MYAKENYGRPTTTALWTPFILLTALGIFSVPASAVHQQAREKAVDFCEKILAMDRHDIGSLQSESLVIESTSGLYTFHPRFQNDDPYLAQEMASLAKLNTYLPGKIQTIGTFGPMSGVPVVDAIFYPEDGSALNVSVKLATGDSLNGMNSLAKRLNEAWQAVDDHYSADFMGAQFGVKILNGEFQRPGGLDNQRYRLGMARALTKLLGLPPNGKSLRPVMILLDRSNQVLQTPKLYSDLGDRRPKLRILDSRIDESTIERPFTFDLAELQGKLKMSPTIRVVAVLFQDRMLMIDSENVRMMEASK